MRNVTSYDYEKAKYHSLFDLIKDQNNWKNPIDCWIPKHTFEDFNQAVVFFTSGFLYRTGEESGSFIHCKANGYYVDCGA
jgi:hypothetical protein